MELQNAENSLLPLYEKQLRDTNNAIRNLLSAIEQGLLTRSTKERLDELEAARDSLESKIACEKLSKPRISEEQLRFFLHRFRSMNVEQQSQCKMLIDTFVNAIFLYDDRLVITYNFHEGSETITLNDLHLVEKKNKSGSDIRLVGEPIWSESRISYEMLVRTFCNGSYCPVMIGRERSLPYFCARSCFRQAA